MNSLLRFVCLLVLSLSIDIATAKDAAYETVSKHGKLSVNGLHLVDQYGDQLQLKGMSMFWDIWMPQYYNKATIDGVHDLCHSNAVRAVMTVDTDDGGYLRNPAGTIERVSAVIEAAVADDIYVLIDWQDFEAEKHLASAREFFDIVSKKYGHYPNVIYETFNEPLSVSWSYVLKPYHEAVISTIRANDPDNLIVVGTPNYSTQVDEAANDPITGYNNIMYTLHFYSGTHRQWLRDIAVIALDKGLPIFVTEYGTVNADASPPVDEEETRRWWDFLDARNMSYLNWSVADKVEGSSVLVPGTRPDQVCQEQYLTDTGRLVVAQNRK
nr:glycoside hydrolase family 5 subfamily 2 [Rhagium bifasciatum]